MKANSRNAATQNAYDRTHESLIRALFARARREPHEAIEHALAARVLEPAVRDAARVTSITDTISLNPKN